MDDLEIRYSFKSVDDLLHFNGDGKFLGTQSTAGNELGGFIDASIIPDFYLAWYRIDGYFHINDHFYIDIEYTDLDEKTCNMYEYMLESMSIVELCDYVNTLDGL
jgi:hypothetical protein